MLSEGHDISQFANRLQDAIDWLRGRGIRVEGTRFAQYLKELNNVISSPGFEARIDDPMFERIMETFESGGELIVIHSELGNLETEEFDRRLRIFVKGTYLQRKELPSSSSSNWARNHGFELYFAARLARANFSFELPSEGDLRTLSPVIRFECKRPQSIKKVESALRGARDQLQAQVETAPVLDVIALSVGKVIHRGSKFLHVGKPEEAAPAVTLLLDQFVDSQQHIWRAPSFSHIAGVWIHYSGTMVFSELPAFVRGTYDRIVLLCNSEQPERQPVLTILAKALDPGGRLEKF